MQFFRFKDVIPTKLQAPVAYKYRCFNATYIGKTKRQLTVRIVEQNGQPIKTNITLAKPPYIAIREHGLEADHPIHTLIQPIKHHINSNNNIHSTH